MNLETFAQDMASVLTRSLPAPGRPLVWTIIANPKAGGFTMPSRWKVHHAVLKAYGRKAQANPSRNQAGPSRTALETDSGPDNPGALGLIATKFPGHATDIVRALIDEARPALMEGLDNAPFYLLITAGGDGTSLEALNALYAAPAALRSGFAVLRLPMGTGNDGADARELAGALDLLIHPTRIEYQRALRLRTAGSVVKGPFLAFNILSVGLDAFVTHMTNKMKGRLPGDSYKLWVDIAALLYDRIYKVGSVNVQGFDEAGGLVQSFSEKILLLAMGASGHRTYGSHKRILPDHRNVCMVRQMPLLRKLALKGLFTSGGHINTPEALLFNAHRIELNGENPILAQMDGESTLLEAADFPVSIELTEPAIPVLKRILE